MSVYLVFIKGLVVGLGLIIAIGAQNGYLLNNGLKRQHRFLSALTCTVIDVLLIAAGVSGLGYLVSLHPLILVFAKWFGVIFLLAYALRSFFSVFKNQYLQLEASQSKQSKKTVLITLLSLSLLNPHVYLDTVLLIGSIGVKYQGLSKLAYGLGAMSASVIWFFSLVFLSGFLAPLFKKAVSWRILDAVIGIIMLVVAANLFIWQG